MEASYGWKCQQEKDIADERELMQHLQEHSVAGRKRDVPEDACVNSGFISRKPPRNRGCKGISGSTASKCASGSRGSIG